MTAEMGCDQVSELASELALGIAAGEERDRALRHLSGCPDCRRLVAELSSVGDELLLLAPERQPPPEFESRVLADLRQLASSPSPGPSVARAPPDSSAARVVQDSPARPPLAPVPSARPAPRPRSAWPAGPRRWL